MTRGWSAINKYILEAKWMHVLIPLVVLTFYFVSFSFFLSWLLPTKYSANVNADFVNKAWKFSLLLTAGLYLFFYVVFKIKKGNKLTFKNSIERLYLSDFILILLPLTPVVQYILNNQDLLSPLGSLCVFGVFAVSSVVLVIVIPTLLGIVGSTKTLMIMGLAFTFTITNMASLSTQFSWYQVGNTGIQLGLLSAVFLGGWILYNLIGRKYMYFLVVIIFIANSAIQLVPGDSANIAPSGTDNRLVELVGSKKPLATPSIYLLIYDAYVNNETMLSYGIDNSAQEKYLEALGFELYPHTYTIGTLSITSMSRVLNASAEYYGPERRGVSGDGIVQNLLRSFGYETYGVFAGDYFFWGIGSHYDYTMPEVTSNYLLFTKAILMGEFRGDVDVVFSKIGEYWWVDRLIILQSVPQKPRFVYTHIPLPKHSPLTGACLPDQTAVYQEKLSWANSIMKQDIETITENDPGAVIVVAGDHGPYLTKNCYFTGGDYDISEISRLDIQDRFGAFLAIKWPDEDYSEYDDITVLQDVFPAIFAYLLADDTLLEAKVATRTLDNAVTSGAYVENGIIHGGINDGEPLFID